MRHLDQQVILTCVKSFGIVSDNNSQNIDLFKSFGIVSHNNSQNDVIEDNAINNPENPLLQTSLFGSIMEIQGSNDENDNLPNPKTTSQQIRNAFGFEEINCEFEEAKNKLNSKIEELKETEQQNKNIKNSNFYKEEVAELKKQIDEAQKCLGEVSGKNVGIEKMKEFIDTSRRGCLAVDRLIWYYNTINLFEERISEEAQSFKSQFSKLKESYVDVEKWVKSNNLQNSEKYQFISNKIKELDQFNVDDCKSSWTIGKKTGLLNMLESKIGDLTNIFRSELLNKITACTTEFEKFQEWAKSVETSEEYEDIVNLFMIFRFNAARIGFFGKTDKESNDKYKELIQIGNELISKMNKFQEEHANNDRKISKRRMANSGIVKDVKRAKITEKEALFEQTQWKNLTGKVEQNQNKTNSQHNVLQNTIYNNKRRTARTRFLNDGQRREAEKAKKIAAETSQAQNGFKHLSKRLEKQHIDNDLKEVLKKKEQIKNNQNSNASSNKKLTLNNFRSLLA